MFFCRDIVKWRFTMHLAFLLVLSSLITACKKKESGLGIDALNQNELLNAIQVDTFTLETYSYLEDSVISDNAAFAVLGSYNDPVFGVFNAGFYTQLRLSGINPNFGNTNLDTIKVDSVILGLQYAGYYGDLSEQTLEVYEIAENLYLDSTYYSFDSKQCKSNNLLKSGFELFTPNPSEKTIIGNDSVSPQLRIHLSDLLGYKLIAAAIEDNAFSSNETFLDYFKGLHVRVNNTTQSIGKGGVFYFDLNAPLSKMTIYYHQLGIAKSFDFLINTECADFNHVEIDNQGKPVNLAMENPMNGAKQYYCQAFRSRAIVNIPSLNNFPENAIIHKADLLLPIQSQTGSKYEPPNELSAAIRINNQLTSIGVFGQYDIYNKHYSVNIRNYLQALVNKEINTTKLVFSPRYFINSAERVIFNGINSYSKKKPQLIITYTKF